MTEATKKLDKKTIIPDCINRERYRCKKLNKTVAIDARDPEQPTCWDKPYCKHFEEK